MAKESMKAREVKRAKLVAKYAAKREKLLKEGDYEGLQSLPKKIALKIEPMMIYTATANRGI